MGILEVFLVEDNPADVLLVRVALSQFPFPIKLDVAKDGEEALKMLKSPDFEPQLIILDLNMPRMDGQTVLRQYQQDKFKNRLGLNRMRTLCAEWSNVGHPLFPFP
jgi:CheY-like chemotaxis protein